MKPCQSGGGSTTAREWKKSFGLVANIEQSFSQGELQGSGTECQGPKLGNKLSKGSCALIYTGQDIQGHNVYKFNTNTSVIKVRLRLVGHRNIGSSASADGRFYDRVKDHCGEKICVSSKYPSAIKLAAIRKFLENCYMPLNLINITVS